MPCFNLLTHGAECRHVARGAPDLHHRIHVPTRWKVDAAGGMNHEATWRVTPIR